MVENPLDSIEFSQTYFYTFFVTDERYWKGIQRFNERDFFEAHEILESLWHEYRESDRPYLQALIQVSAGLYHADAGNYRGARSQLTKGLQKLNQYPGAYQGIDVHMLAKDIGTCLAVLDTLEHGNTEFSTQSFFPQINIMSDHS